MCNHLGVVYVSPNQCNSGGFSGTDNQNCKELFGNSRGKCCSCEPIGPGLCNDNYDGNDCAGGIEFFNAGSEGSTGEECCVCGPNDCFVGCDTNWECVARRKLEKIEKNIRG